MAHFAEIDENNSVQRVIVVHNNELLDENGEEKEALGVAFCKNLLGGTWLQTSYNKNMRKNFAGIGFTYDIVRDAFIPPKPYDSWVLDEATCLWKSPVAYPSDENYYEWDETNTKWVEMTQNILE
jgi:hypothetical protein|tara:strand:- start:204 stop:578 length:375 start_codon:yes stop_codon:yes gene_type:complete